MALDGTGNEIVTLSEPSTITVKYLEADVAAACGGTDDLVLAYWDEAAGKWKTLKTSVDTANMTLSASTTHVGTWAVLARNNFCFERDASVGLGVPRHWCGCWVGCFGLPGVLHETDQTAIEEDGQTSRGVSRDVHLFETLQSTRHYSLAGRLLPSR